MATKKIACVGDTSDHGGTIINSNTDDSVKAGGDVVAAEGAEHDCPEPGHGITPITAVTTKTKVNGRLVLTYGAIAGCGAIINPTDRNVYVE